MTARSGSTVYVAMPVYRGVRFVAETLRSVLAQTHRDLRVMISVDGADSESAAVCEPFLADERVRLVVQDRRLGWVANMNWLIDACDGDFFCYWQQDDLCAPEYLERLLAALARHPDAVAAYSDLRRFEQSSDEVVMPSIVGFTQQRILAEIELLHWLPLRALVTADALRGVGPIRGLDDSIAFSDYLWVLRLAVVGDMIRVPEVLYFKRHHLASASHNPSHDFRRSPREAWLMLGLEIFREVSPRFEERDWPRLARVLGDRLATPPTGGWAHYDAAAVSASEQVMLALDFHRALRARHGEVPAVASPAGDTDDVASDRAKLVAAVGLGGPVAIGCSASGWSHAVLAEGWSRPEAWGTWTDGSAARLWLPLPGGGGRWSVRLMGRGYAGPPGSALAPRLIVSLAGRQLLDVVVPVDDAILPLEVPAPQTPTDGLLLDLSLPDARSPAELGLGEDQRRLGVGLTGIELVRVADGAG